jgi:hypothetical protein
MWINLTGGESSVKLNTDHITLLYPEDRRVVMSCGTQLRCTAKEYGEVEKTLFPTRKAYSKDDTALAEFLNQLHKLCGGKNEAILTPQRNKKLTDLLKSFSKDQLITAATNIGKDKFLQGENDNHKRYGDIDYLLRPDKAARYAELNPEDKKRKMF